MKLERIKELTPYYSGGIKRLSARIGMTESNLHRCIRENKIQAQDLEKIAKELNVGVELFYDDSITLEQYMPKGKYAFAAKSMEKVETHETSGDSNGKCDKEGESETHQIKNGEMESLKKEVARLSELNKTKDISIKTLMMTIEAKDEVIAFLKQNQK